VVGAKLSNVAYKGGGKRKFEHVIFTYGYACIYTTTVWKVNTSLG